ncbi:MAG: M3 family metallopeptidase [Verrucomicrobia bacterium]|nr:M3 family metallopeptidase [Verrucomicrobiota bacterium]
MILLGCAAPKLCAADAAADSTAPMTTTQPAENPLLHESALPLHYPRFDLIKDDDFLPAIDAGMAEQLKEVDAIVGDRNPPTFENTVVALEKSGQTLTRANRIFSNLVSADTNPARQKIESALAPKLAAHNDAIRLNGALFSRIDRLFAQRDQLGLDPESEWLLERYEKDFVRAGAKLSDADKTRLKAMNAELAALQTQFTQNVLKEKNAASLVVEDRAELAGLAEPEIAAAAAAAKADGKEGKFLLPLLNTSGQPQLTSLENRGLRERLLETSLARNAHGGEWDNREIVLRIARLRAEKAALLGYENFAAYQLDDQTAGNVPTVNKLLAELAPPAVANAKREAGDIQAEIDQEHAGFQAAAWDWDFYSEKVRRARYAFDAAQLKPYFELNHVLQDGVFFAANKFYGLTFKERHDLPVYQPDVRVFDVFDADGKPLAIFLGDYYARPSKRGGAWMNAYVNQSALLGTQPVVANHLNIPKPPAGEPTLLTLDEVRTCFHEFGHALHGMFSSVKYPRFSGTNVPRDFVEYPSQVNEMWMSWPEVLKHYARHYQTGEPMPAALLDKVLAADKFNQGYKTTEYLAATLLDQAWHQLKPAEVPTDMLAFEAEALKRAGVDLPLVPPRYRSAYFSHAFSGGYAAGYYSYLWSEVLDADSVEWIKAHGGLTRANGDRFRQTLLSRGGSADALGLFRDFTGGEPDLAPLLKRRGLEPAAPASSAR